MSRACWRYSQTIKCWGKDYHRSTTRYSANLSKMETSVEIKQKPLTEQSPTFKAQIFLGKGISFSGINLKSNLLTPIIHWRDNNMNSALKLSWRSFRFIIQLGNIGSHTQHIITTWRKQTRKRPWFSNAPYYMVYKKKLSQNDFTENLASKMPQCFPNSWRDSPNLEVNAPDLLLLTQESSSFAP